MKVLVVEDNTEKLRKITLTLSAVSGFDLNSLSHVVDVRSAKIALRDTRFDLLILDVSLPPRIDQEVQRDAGLQLLEEILERSQYKVPTHIIGLTAHEDIYAAVADRFMQRLLTLVRFDPSSDEWIRQIQMRVRHILMAEQQQLVEPPQYKSHLCIVCALETLELESVLRIPWSWNQVHSSGDDTIYHRGAVHRDGKEYVVYAAAAPRMGMSATAVLATKMICAFRPAYLGMVGITAGVRSRTKFGDAIIADPSWDYGNGKWVTRNKKNTFLAAPHQLPLDTTLRKKFLQLKADTGLLARIRSEWPGDPPDHVLSVKIGPLASGAAVLADNGTLERVTEQHRELLGIEMETYGVFAAAAEAVMPRPLAFSIKSVVDFADEEKDDRFQRYSAYTSAQVLKYFVESLL